METIGTGRPGVLDASGTVVTDISCRRCSYNLRGLQESGLCPECGTPIGLSIMGDLLRYADPDWLAKLAKGASFILWGILVGIVVGLIGAVVSQGNEAVAPIIGLLGGLLGLYGAWLLTEPDPSGLNEGQYMTARKIVRFALLVGLGANVLQVIASGSQSSGVAVVIGLIAVAAALVGVVGEIAKLAYLETLARRIPDDALGGRARFLKWAYGISLGTMAVMGALAGMLVVASGGSGGGPGGGIMAVGCVAGIAGLAMVVFAIMSLFLVYRMGQAFRREEAVARHIWSQAAVPAQPAQ